MGGDIAITFSPPEGEQGRKQETWVGRIVDVSRNGMKLAVSAKGGSTIRVRDRLHLEGMKTCLISALRGLQVGARVQNKEPGRNGTFEIGLRLDGVSEIDRGKIERALTVLRKRVKAQRAAQK